MDKNKGYVKGVFSRNVFIKVSFNLKDTYWMFLKKTKAQICPQALRDLIQTWNRENKYVALHNVSMNRIIKIYEDFLEKVRLGLLGKKARF